MHLRVRKEEVPLTIDSSRSWVSKAESALRALRDVDGVSIQLEEDEIVEIHILTHSSRPAKQIVRDVITVLMTRFNRRPDHKKISVAYVKGDPPPPPVVLVDHEPEDESESPMRRSEPASRQRIRFTGVNLFVSGARIQAQVELQWNGLPRLGSISGWSTRSGANRLVAQATLAAVQELLVEEAALVVHEVQIVRLGRRRAVVVSLGLLADRQEKTLVGSCVVEQDVPQAVVLATLAALNRVVGQLHTKEPTEYILRPTST
jgi:hypothetical protein